MRMTVSNLNERPHFMLAVSPVSEQPIVRSPAECGAAVARAAVRASTQTFPRIEGGTLIPGARNAYVDYASDDVANDPAAQEWRSASNGEFRLRVGFWECTDAYSQTVLAHNTVYPSRPATPIRVYINLVALVSRVTAACLFTARYVAELRGVREVELTIGLGGALGVALGRIDEIIRFPNAPVFPTATVETRRRLNDLVHPPSASELACDALQALTAACEWTTTRATFAAWQSEFERSMK